jgi:hypothetical protein
MAAEHKHVAMHPYKPYTCKPIKHLVVEQLQLYMSKTMMLAVTFCRPTTDKPRHTPVGGCCDKPAHKLIQTHMSANNSRVQGHIRWC